MVARLEHDGVVGFGQAAPSKRVTGEDIDSVSAFLRWAATTLPKEPDDLLPLLQELHENICGNPSARAALDLAAFDLLGRRAGVPARTLLGLAPGRIETSATVSLDAPEAMAAEARAWAARGFGILKLKLGEAAGDRGRVRAVRDAVPRARISVDANGAWSRTEASNILPFLADEGVLFAEQPTAPRDLAALAEVSASSPIPVFADESVHDEHDIERLLRAGFRGGATVKIQKAGGLKPAAQTLRRAREAGLSTMLGCNVECAIGIAGGLQLLSLLDHADLDGSFLLLDDPFHTSGAEGSRMESPRRAGLGVDSKETRARSDAAP